VHTHPRITKRHGYASQHIIHIAKEHTCHTAGKRIEADKTTKPLRLGALRGLTGYKVEKALDFDLDDRLDDGRVAIDEQLAKDVGSAERDVKVIAWDDVLDVPENLVVVFLVFGEFLRRC